MIKLEINFQHVTIISKTDYRELVIDASLAEHARTFIRVWFRNEFPEDEWDMEFETNGIDCVEVL